MSSTFLSISSESFFVLLLSSHRCFLKFHFLIHSHVLVYVSCTVFKPAHVMAVHINTEYSSMTVFVYQLKLEYCTLKVKSYRGLV